MRTDGDGMLSCLQVGISTGDTKSEVQANGRMSYRGKVMNRAARIAAMATSGQVLCLSAF